MRPAVFGLVVGLAASLEAGQLMRDLLYEIKPLDPAVYAAVGAKSPIRSPRDPTEDRYG
jgi:hypothetical protein